MNAKREWPRALRLVWLTGGLVAVNEPEEPDVQIKTNVNGQTITTFQIPTYGSLYPILKSLGFLLLGTTFVTNPKQAEGLHAPEFRAASGRDWQVWETRQRWGEIASAAARRDEMRLMDVTSRISTGLAHSEMRLYDLAMSYSAQLHSHH